MRLQKSMFIFHILILALVVLAINACGETATVVRKVTYPPDFKYISKQQLRSGMGQLAFQLQLLDQALAESDTEQSVQQQKVSDILLDIERIAADMQAGEAGSNHPFLQNHMSRFVTDVSQARIAASLNPPRYYLAGRVAGGCVNCHKFNR